MYKSMFCNDLKPQNHCPILFKPLRGGNEKVGLVNLSLDNAHHPINCIWECPVIPQTRT